MDTKKNLRLALSYDELHLLDMKVLPTAKRWMMEHPIGSSMFSHGLQTVEYWGAQDDPDIVDRYNEHVRKQNSPKDRQLSMDEWNDHIRIVAKIGSMSLEDAERRELFGNDKMPPVSSHILPDWVRAKRDRAGA